MAALALGAVGAGVGSFFGAASIGWSIGSALGNYLLAPDQPDIEGPRLTDRRVSGSAYGTMRPKLYGTYRMAGEIIWSDEIKERKHKEEQGGKGGGGGDYITYTYDVSFAMALCEGECSGIRKIWMDSKLVYTAADDSSVGELIASEKIARKIKFYPGSIAQEPDATIEAVKGSGNVPAYRGTCYLVFERLEISQFGNRIPQITVEVVKNGAYSLTDDVPSDVQTGLPHCSIAFVNGTLTHYNWVFDTDDLEPEQRVYDVNDLSTVLETRRGLATGAHTRHAAVSPNYKIAVFGTSDVSGTNNRIEVKAFVAGAWQSIPYFASLTTEDLDNLINLNDSYGHLIKWESDYSFYFYKSNSGDLYKYEVTLIATSSGIVYQLDIVFNEKVASDATDAEAGAPYAIAIDRLSRDVFVSLGEVGTNKIKRYSSDGELLETKTADNSPYNIVSNGAMGFSNGLLWQIYQSTGAHIKIIEWDTDTIIYDGSLSASASGWGVHQPVMEVAGNTAFIFFGGFTLYKASLNLGGTNETLDDVVLDICTTVGIDAGDVDVTDLASDEVRGYLISGQTPARGALEQLSAAYFFDGRESDGILDFAKRGDSPTVTLDDDDLGCYEGNDVQELADAVRMQEEELPKALTLVYANVSADYQSGAQYAIRQSVLNGTESTIQLPIAFTDDEAKVIVDKMMFSAWENRHRFTLKTWQSFCKLDPADVISARGETLRIIARNEGVNGIIELEAARELPQIYTGQVGSGSSGSSGGQTVEVGGPTKIYLLDIPPLRDTDYNNYGFYAAANGYLADWPGYTLVKADSTETNFSAVLTSDAGAAIGQAVTALGDWTGGNVFDETNVVRVSVIGTLETKTRAQILDGANVAVIGDEIIQFMTATLISTGIYDLSGLLRGRLGTEWAMDEHIANERFAILDASSTRFAPVPYTDINALRNWGGITFGDTIEEALTQYFQYTGNNLKPWSPVHIGAGKTVYNSDITINWKRRSRAQWQWLDRQDVGNDESSNDFEVRIMDGVTVKRTISVTNATTTTYTNADQVTDFGTNQVSIDVQIRQIGANRNSEWSDVVTLNTGFLNVVPSTFLCHCDGTNGSTTFTDIYGRAITPAGNAQISTAQSKFGGASALLDGTGDYLSVVNTSDWDLGGSFSIDLWIRPAALTSSPTLFSGSLTAGGSNEWYFQYDTATSRLVFGDTTTGTIASSAGALSLNVWQHVCVSRNGTNVLVFIDGVPGTAGTSSASFVADNGMLIGAFRSASGFFNGYMDELSLVKGTARYTAAFTPPTTAYTD
jgi:hypothetical protein